MESDLEELQRQIAGVKELIRRTKIEVAEVAASVDQICLIKQQLLVFLRHRFGKPPVRVRIGKRRRFSSGFGRGNSQTSKGDTDARRPNCAIVGFSQHAFKTNLN